MVLSVTEGDTTATGVFGDTALKIDPSSGEVKINVKDKAFVPYDFDHPPGSPASDSLSDLSHGKYCPQ